MSTTFERHGTTAAPTRFDRVLVGIDGSAESHEAARQAARLTEGELTLLACYDTTDALIGGTGLGVPVYYDEAGQKAATKQALVDAAAVIPGVEHTALVGRGRSWDVLLAEIARSHPQLVAVGSHGNSRLTGIVLGSTATELVHRAPCSVLVARAAGADFPSRIAVGVDGSEAAETARATAEALAERFGATLQVVEAESDPVSMLEAAAHDADLVVVGSRGLQGLKALGSVSERIAHRAACSVLIVR